MIPWRKMLKDVFPDEHVHVTFREVSVPALFIFLFFFLSFFSVKLAYPDLLSSPDDPYFHARYSAILAEGESPPLPYMSTISWFSGGSLYSWYHTTFSSLLRFFEAESDLSIILVSKFFHAILAALLLMVFFTVAYRLVCRFTQDMRIRRSGALLSTVLLLILVPSFYARLLFDRPFLIAGALFLIVIDALISKAPIRLFVAGALLTVFYSFTGISVLPVVLYCVSGVLIHGVHTLRRTVLYPCVFIGGLVGGLLLLPNPIHYVFNAHYVQGVALWNAITGVTIEGGEITILSSSAYDWIWFIPTLILILFSLRLRAVRHDPRLYRIFFLGLLTLVFFILTILFNRAVEYFAPIFILTGTAVVAFVVTTYHTQFCALRTHLTKPQRYVVISTLVVFVGLGSLIATNHVRCLPVEYNTPTYAAMFDEVQKYAVSGDKVFIPLFHDFAPGFFYAPQLQYSQGMSSTFTYIADEERFWLAHHVLTTPDVICARKECVQTEMSAYEVIRNKYDAKFVLYEYKMGGDIRNRTYDPTSLATLLAQDDRFEKIFDTVSSDIRFVAYRVQ